ncbi:NUDIX domain-containing protein [Xylariaceae sp. FL0594]|nr:NUDIX domain-containing protein [Xylariaceae sp. FL0594]
MAASQHKSNFYTPDLFVEACGAIVFDGHDSNTEDSNTTTTTTSTRSSQKRILLLYHPTKDVWLLPKGRRNLDESRRATAVREVREESGFAITLVHLKLPTRAPADNEPFDVRDEARVYERAIVEPFMLDVRDLGKGQGVKLVWWFIGELDRRGNSGGGGGGGEGEGNNGVGEEQFEARFVDAGSAVERLTFLRDRFVVQRAIEVLERQDKLQ